MNNNNTTYIETRSIEPIPDGERHGSIFSQFTLWLGANLQITAMVTGALTIVFGGDVFWSLAGLMLGQIAGGIVMALHAAQGPQLGIPQMISSRVQFGVYGALPADSAGLPDVPWFYRHRGGAVRSGDLGGFPYHGNQRHSAFRCRHAGYRLCRLSVDPPVG